jgi:ribonucleoside-diphosphate reductase alpha chain
MEEIKVRKRNGRLVNVDLGKIQTRIKKASTGLKVNHLEVSMKVVQGLYDGVTTKELDKLAADTAASLTTNHPDYSKLASNIAISALHKDTSGDFEKAFNILKENKLLNQEYIDRVISYGLDNIKNEIDYNRDYMFDYFGFKTLEKAYLLKIYQNNKDIILERPQDMYMREAITVTKNWEDAKETYKMLSEWNYTHATPTMFNSGLKGQQLASCFLINNKGDSKEGIMDTFKDVSIISSFAGGIGLNISNLRAAGSKIHSTNGTSNGIMPYLRTSNELAKYWDQGGNKRKGSFAIYLEPWHSDIFTLLDIRKTHGSEDLRARDLFPALWIPDLFYKQVESNGDWYLSCPNEQIKAGFTRLDELHSEKFEEEYYKIASYIDEGKMPGKKIKARDLWDAIINAQIETGTPYMLNKDHANSKSNQQNLGTIKSSNLCTEIIEYSSPEEQAVCNLASVNLTKFVKFDENNKPYFDFIKFANTIYVGTKNLNTVIDKNIYPTKETEHSNKKHRPIGWGVQGLADVFALMRFPFDSEDAKKLNKEIFEVLYFSALDSSCDLAQEEGPYQSYEGSPILKGILQPDMWGLNTVDRTIGNIIVAWSTLRKRIQMYGVRNSLLVAPMPTASTAQIMSNNEAFEPFKSLIGTRRVLSGEFIIINKHLINDLEELGLWDEYTKYDIIINNGSIQTLEYIPKQIRDIYKTVWDLKMKDVIDMAADRGAFIDQSQSMNLWMAEPNLNKISSMHMYSWKKGLKTGMYYLRTKAASQAIQSLGIEKPKERIFQPPQEDEDCLFCSS